MGGNARSRWWQARVPPWTAALVLAGAGLWGLVIGFNWI